MNRIKLKCGGKPKRKKALFGELAVAGATLAAAGINAAATASAAKQQSKAIVDNAKSQADALKAQNENNNELQQQNIAFTRSQNQEIKQQQQDIQTTLQMLAGQQNMNDRMENNKMQVKYGGSTKRRKLKQSLPYRGGDLPFEVTDGGGAIPISTDYNGYGLYELFGNDHEHYHKTRGGKNKTGVGIKFANGEVIEGEGNQNTNQGELMYVTPNDAMFISKHNINGFNPTKAVQSGMHPEDAFAIQENIKDVNGYNDDGTKAKCGGRRKLKAMMGIYNPIYSTTSNLNNVVNDSAIAASSAYIKNRNNAPIAKCGKKVSIRRKADWGSYWKNYGNATLTSAGALGGATISTIGNMVAGNSLAKANEEAGQILSDAYGKLKTVDLNIVDRDDFNTGTSMAAVVDANNYRNNAMRERLRRDKVAYDRDVNRNTMSSAARQQRLASQADRTAQAMSQVAEDEANRRLQYRDANANRIQQASEANAARKAQSIKDWTLARLDLAKYNNDIENLKITGAAQSEADALLAGSVAKSTAAMNSANAFGSALSSAGTAFGTAMDNLRKEGIEYSNNWYGYADYNKVSAALHRAEQTGDMSYVNAIYSQVKASNDKVNKPYAKAIEDWATKNGVKLNSYSSSSNSNSIYNPWPSFADYINDRFSLTAGTLYNDPNNSVRPIANIPPKTF